MMHLFFIVLLIFVPSILKAEPYIVNKEKSLVSFSGLHAGNRFDGQFEDWTAIIDFNDDDLDMSSVKFTLRTSDAKTGNALYDGTLPTNDWFDSTNYPTASFVSKKFTKKKGGYNVSGDLTIKNITETIAFDFQLTNAEPRIMTATFPIERKLFDIGKKSDPNAEWVSKDIEVDIKIIARKAE